ncbi:MAG TPA: response regulator transcription factor [Planctomycetota bacterium]|nr:response regulator transcription factor [Planctomycetota bacterium]
MTGTDKAQILVTEDEENLRVTIKDKLELEGFQVEVAGTAEDAWRRFQTKSYDLAILDVVLPGMSGLELLKQLRDKEKETGAHTPVMLLTARAHESDKVLGLELGADDYMTKPFGARELVARVRAHIRRERAQKESSEEPPPPAPAGFKFGECIVDFAGYKMKRKGKEARLSALEWKILSLLVRERGRTVTRERFLREIWGYDKLPITRTVDFHVSRLRAKVDDAKDPKHIVTVHGIGYRFEE